MATYTGRFAPTPSGPLHQGSLLTALASFLEARANKGKWLVRMDDLDEPRNQPGADAAILFSLEQHGLFWDDQVLYQSTRIEAYNQALSSPNLAQKLFYCQCSRKQLIDFTAYPGTCRGQTNAPANKDFARRVKVEHLSIGFDDLFQGQFQQDLSVSGGDFIVHRRDGIFAYHLTCAVDDAFQNISHIIRGADLLESTVAQLYLTMLLDYDRPIYGHIPVIVDDRGHKLSKHSRPPAIDASPPAHNLYRCLVKLGQNPPLQLQYQAVDSVIQWGLENWRTTLVPRIRQFAFDESSHSE